MRRRRSPPERDDVVAECRKELGFELRRRRRRWPSVPPFSSSGVLSTTVNVTGLVGYSEPHRLSPFEENETSRDEEVDEGKKNPFSSSSP